jgi:hypothetical protein
MLSRLVLDKTSSATGRENSCLKLLQQPEQLTFFSETSISGRAKLIGPEVVVNKPETMTPDHSIGSVLPCLSQFGIELGGLYHSVKGTMGQIRN